MAKRRIHTRRQIDKGTLYDKAYKQTRKLFTKLYNYKTADRLLKQYRKVAKMADQRLVRLEQEASRPGYENIKEYAYARAVSDIESWDKAVKPGKEYAKMRFNRNIPMKKGPDGKMVPDLEGIKAKLTDIERFLISVTSTRAGVTEFYEKRADTLNRHHYLRGPSRITWEDMKNYFESELADELKEEEVGSDTIVRAIGSIKRHQKELTPDRIKQAAEKNIRIARDDNVNEVANMLLRRGFDPKYMFAGNA